jgi:prefoldin subunit 5
MLGLASNTCFYRQVKVDLKKEVLAEKKASIARLTTNVEDLRKSRNTLKMALDEVRNMIRLAFPP